MCLVDEMKWGIEVTRSNQRVVHNGSTKSQSELSEPLWRFSEKLKQDAEKIRNLSDGPGYRLYLDGPPKRTSFKSWKQDTTNTIKQFIELRCDGICKFDGGKIYTSKSGPKWLSFVGQRLDAQTLGGLGADIDPNIDAMLRHSLDDKSPKLLPIPKKDNFDKIGLLLLNTYPFADNIADVRTALQRIICEKAEYSIFDSVFFVVDGRLSLIFEKVDFESV